MKKLLLALALFWPGFAFGQSIGSPSVPTSFSSLCPGASNGQVLYDNNGACGGITGVTTNGTTTFVFGSGVTVTGPDSGTWTSAGLNSIVAIGSGAAAPSAGFATTQAIGGTSTDGVLLTNTTAATSGNQKWSPRLHFTGQGWKTTATAASQTVDWIAELQPAQNTTSPNNNLVFSAQTNGGGYSAFLTLVQSITSPSNNAVTVNAAELLSNGDGAGSIGNSAARWGSIWLFTSANLVSNTAPLTFGASTDTSIARSSAGVLQINNSGSAGSGGSLLLTNITASGASINLTGLGHTSEANVLCYNTGTGLVTYSTIAENCTVSKGSLKEAIVALSPIASLDAMMQLKPVSFNYKAEAGMDDARHIGLIAEQVAQTSPDLVAYENDGVTPHSVKYQELPIKLLSAVQAMQAEIEQLKQKVH